MRSLLFLALLLFSLAAPAQTESLPLLQQVMDHFNKEEYEKAIPVIEKAIGVTKKEMGESSPFHSGMVLFLSISHLKLYHYTEAEKSMAEYCDLVLKYTGEKTTEYSSSLNQQAFIKRELGKYAEAEHIYVKALDLVKSMSGEDTVYAKSLNNLASLHQFLGRYDKAEQMLLQSAAIIRRMAGERSELYINSQNNLGTLYSDKGQLEKAKTVMQRVVELWKLLSGEMSRAYAESLNNLAFVFASLGQYTEAEIRFNRARELMQGLSGENNAAYASIIDNLADLYSKTGEFEKAEQLYKQALTIRKKTVGENHTDYAQSLNNLASFYSNEGRFDMAEQLFQESKTKTLNTVGETHPFYIITTNNLAAHYHSRGQYAKAEPLYQQAKELRRKILGASHPSYALSLNNLAVLYFDIGQYEKAEPLYIQATDIWKTTVGATHPDYAMGLNNLAAVYEEGRQYERAEQLYTQAKDIRKSVFGENHNDYAISLNNLATLYVRMGQYSKAENYILQANAIWKRILRDDNPNIALGLNNLAAAYRRAQVKLPEAEQLYLQAIERRKKVLGENHPRTADAENDLALLYMNMKQYKKAEPLLLGSSNKTMQNLPQVFTVLSEKEKADYISENLFFNDCSNSFLYNYPAASPAIINNNLNLQLFFKSLSLADTRNMLDALRNSKDEQVRKLAEEWQQVRAILAAQYALPATNRMKNLVEKAEEAERLEKELNRRSVEFRLQQAALQTRSRDVRDQLGADEAAIEFVSFKYYNKRQTDSIMYAAYIILKADTTALFVPLFEEKQLQELISQAGRSATGVAKVLYGVAMNFSSDIADNLYKLVWKPLEKHLKGISKIAYSPAGKLYGIAFHALPVGSGKILQDKYELRQYVSTRQIAFRSLQKSADKPADIALFGDAEFSMDSTAIAREFSVNLPANDIALRGGGGGWPALPFTGTEVDTIKRIFDQKGIMARAYLKIAANEGAIKKMDGHSPSILHIATHGFYVPEAGTYFSGNNVYKLSNDPLMRNGLILAGGNYAWGGNIPVKGSDDGVLTAYEIAQMNLSNTKLVVLSACETALGDIKGSEGVFGLQRAFKMAGVDKMIVSLWQVPDMETSLLMTKFYANWLGGAAIGDAFYQAQAEMRKTYPPFNWAAFVLVE